MRLPWAWTSVKKLLWITQIINTVVVSYGATAHTRSSPPHYRGLMITLRHTTLSRPPLDEWSARRSVLYLTTHNTHKRGTSMPVSGFEPAIPACKRPQTHPLDRAATGIGNTVIKRILPCVVFLWSTRSILYKTTSAKQCGSWWQRPMLSYL